MDQYTNGWQNRLTSSMVNAPSRAGFVTHGFGLGAAAPYMQALGSLYNGAFGFAGNGGGAQRDAVQGRFPQIMNTLIGQIQRPAGFEATGMAMSGGVPMGGVLHPGAQVLNGTIKLEVILKDPGGATIGRHNTSATIAALQGGALTLTASAHSAGVSRQ